MGNDAVKNIVLIMVLLVFSVLIGSQISDGFMTSLSAFALIGTVVAAFIMLLVGTQSWKLLYYVPAAIFCLPLVRRAMPVAYTVCLFVFFYGILQSMMGKVSFRWRGHLVLDLLVAALLFYCIGNYIKYPVSIHYFDPEAEFVGGKEYVFAVLAFIYYIAISCMSGSAKEIITVSQRCFYILCAFQVVVSLCEVLYYHGAWGIRYQAFGYLGCPLLYFVFCSAPIVQLLRSPKAWGLMLVSMALLLLHGNREFFGFAGETVGFAALLKRELLGFAFVGIVFYGFFLFMGHQGVLEKAPYSLQRVVTILPGIKVSKLAEIDTRGSSATRRLVWGYALDPRTGVIKDYIWGDGFQTSTQKINRAAVAAMRGLRDHLSNEDFAMNLASGTNNFHNGWLSTLKTLGLVGLVLVNLIFICGMVMLVQVSVAYKRHPAYPYLMAQCLVYAQYALSYMWGTQTLITYFNTFMHLGMIKLLYCAAREQGWIVPMINRRRYVPMMIREAEQRVVAKV